LNDTHVLIAIAVILILISGIIQYVICCVCNSLIIKLLPAILFVPIWLICILGAFNVFDLPPTSYIIDGGFIAFHDSDVIAIAGIPINLGLLFSWIVYSVIQRSKKRRCNL
jgi:hypothetical protein